ncbi:MAG: hypothetical protein ABII06_10435, partial [Pseudomonadota bacterium]
SLHPDRARIGSIVELILDYRLPEGASLPEKPEIKGLEGFKIIDSTPGPGRVKIRLLVDRLGPLRSEAVGITYLDREGKAQTLQAGPVAVTVLSNLGEKPAEARLKPIRDIVPTRSAWFQPLFWGAGLGILVLAALGLIWWLRRRKLRKQASDHEEPPHIRARREMEALAARGLFEKGHVKTFYFSFSEILRRYLEALRHFPAAEFTTEEIAQRIKHEQDRRLLPLLKQADLVKFADMAPASTRKEEDIQSALAYIEETGPGPDEAGGEIGKTAAAQGVPR